MFKSRIKSFITLPIIAVSIASCDPGTSKLEYSEFSKEVISVDLIDYKNDNQKSFTSWVPNHEDDLVPFVIENAAVIKSLDNSVLDTFIKQACDYKILHKYYVYDSPKGTCIRMNHKNEDFTILCLGYIGKFSSTGDVKEYYGGFEEINNFDSLLKDYFDYSQE